MKGFVVASVAVLLVWSLCGTETQAQSAENVAVVINSSSAASVRIGEYYVRERGIPPGNVIRVQTSTDDAVTRAAYASTIERPIAVAIARERAYDRILYIVLTKGIPLRIAGTTGQDGTLAGVDSELTLLYRRMTGQNVLTRGRVDNPYFLGAREISDARTFSHRDHDIFLVSRLDAFTVEEAMALVDRAKMPTTEGRIVLDQRDALVNRGGEEWLELAGKRLSAIGQSSRVLLEMTPKPARDVKPVMGYFSWGSTDPQNRARSVGMGFVPGSLAGTFVSTDGRTFKEPPAAWTPTNEANRATWFEGSPQSLVGDLIREGVTGVAGQVSEPFLQSSVRPEILFPAYLAGHNLIEAFYLAIPHLSWQTVVIGDPLCAPFPRKPLSRAELDAGLDAETELPGFFSKRRLAASSASQPGTPARAVSLLVRAETMALRGDVPRARQALEEAVDAAPDAVAPRLQLALLQEQTGQHAAAEEGYRRALTLQPNNAVALNNLAYALAVRKKSPKEGLPFAKRAVALSPNDPNVIDTLAWIEHLTGNDVEAARLMAAAIKSSPGSPEIRLHAAIIYAARGALAVSETELKEALRLAPALEQSEDVKQLRVRLLELEKGAR